jgi:pyruvate/oxaloacetate carboxyltransferase
MGKELAAMGCDSIAIKDMAGLLTPYVAADLVKALKDSVDLPLHLHSHATSGLADMCHLKAIENGCDTIDTAISSMAGGTSHPPTESMVAALRGTPYDTGLDLEAIQEVGMYFYQVRKKYHQFESDYTGVDTRVQVNQVPGGMISNLANQLKEQNALDRMSAVLEEIPRVREDLGYPPLVTPTSQIVGTQAVLNVLTEKRYQTITNEVKLYLQGRYGRAPAPSIRPCNSRRSATRSSSSADRPTCSSRSSNVSSRRSASLATSEEDTLTYAMFPEIGRAFLEHRAAGHPASRAAGAAAERRRCQGRPDRVQHRRSWRDLPRQGDGRRAQGARGAPLLSGHRRHPRRGPGRDPGRGRPDGRRGRRGEEGDRRQAAEADPARSCDHLDAGQHRRCPGQGGRSRSRPVSRCWSPRR